MVHAGSFRQDLYYRLARLVLQVPPLAARPDDLLPLAARFLRALAPELGTRTLSRGAEARLLLHGWPGNARELRNVLGAAAALSGGVVLEPEDITRAIARVSGPLAPPSLDGAQIASAVARYGGNLSAVSRALAIPRSTLRDRLRRGHAPDEPDGGAR
jgi:DNA-binding NtrC family response regulator